MPAKLPKGGVKRGKYPLSFNTYKLIMQNAPIPCVDFVLVNKGRFLMGFRTNKPAQNQWWLPGGRILKNETLQRAVQRKALEEVGIRVRIVQFLLNEETIFKNSPIPGIGYHTINSVFLVTPAGKGSISPDWQNSRLQWFSKIDPTWHPYVKHSLRLAGFK